MEEISSANKEESLSWKHKFFWICFCALNALAWYHLSSAWASLSGERALLLAQLNVTSKSNPNLLLFNRVPKVGSTSMAHLLQALADRNRFEVYSYRVVDGVDSEITSMTAESQLENALYLSHESCPNETCSFYKHMHFIDFTEFNLTNPVYMNLVRHPVDRVQSWYYYIRSASYIRNTPGFMPISRLKGTLSDCIEGLWECGVSFERMSLSVLIENNEDDGSLNTTDQVLKHFKDDKLELSRNLALKLEKLSTIEKANQIKTANEKKQTKVSSQLEYFCGYGKDCQETIGVDNTHKKLARAMLNVDQHYAVVGILEDMHTSLQVFEAMIPRFFRDAVRVSAETQRVNTNSLKPPLSARARAILEGKLEHEIIFYEFCKQRLYRQWKLIKAL